MAEHPFRRWTTTLGVMMSRPWAFVIVGFYSIGWWLFDRHSFDWHGMATLATWLMTLFIQRAEHRDTQAIQAKLDELIRRQDGARDELTKLDDEEPETIEEHRAAARGGET